MKRALLLTLIAWLVPGCDRKPAPVEGAAAVKHQPSARTAMAPRTALPGKESFRFPEAARIVAIGDVHGDLDATRRALRLAGAIRDGDRWSGGKLVVVQTGDQLDRGDDERAIVELFDELAEQAKAAGGAVHALDGNHEIMNVSGDFRYVTEGGFRDFDGVPPPVPTALLARFPEPMRGRVGAFMPGGIYAKKLAARRIVVVVGDTVFAHGGVTPATVDYGIDRLNQEAAAWMSGARRDPPAPLIDPEGPVWTRRYSTEDEPPDCGSLAQALSRLSVKRLVMGHTPQKNGITSACGGRAWRIDVGMARHYGGSVSVLEVVGDRVQSLAAESAAAAAE